MRRLTTTLITGAMLATPAGAGEVPGAAASKDAVHLLTEYRSIDGRANNTDHPDWGAAGRALLRVAPPDYADGTSAPSGTDRPGARQVSNVVMAQEDDRPAASGASSMFWQWGQFLDHDIGLTPLAEPAEEFDIPVPEGDAYFDPTGAGDRTIPLERSTAASPAGVRQQVNVITPFIDASNVYGSDADRALVLRRMDGTGRLCMSRRHRLPRNDEEMLNLPDDAPDWFLAGDLRCNEQVALTALHTIFVREHNRWCRVIARAARVPGRSRARRRPGSLRIRRSDLGMAHRGRLSGEEIYQMARASVGAEMQAVTYREFLPILLGPAALDGSAGYDPDVDPGMTNEFATVAYRVGHTMLASTLRRLGRRGNTIPAGDLPLRDAFFDPDLLRRGGGVEPVLRGLTAQPAQEVDVLVVDDVRCFLFGPPGAGGLDLAALNIQRGRDHGLPSYVDLREALGLPAVTTFDDITSDTDVAARLQAAYGTVDRIDPWVGGLAEDHYPGAMVGPTFRRILSDQFRALRDGDRFWYERHLPEGVVACVNEQTLARIIRRNSRIGRELPDDPWHVR